MIICLGPVCVPIWPIVFLALKPVWNLLPQGYKDSLTAFWDQKCYPKIEPYLDMLPEKLRKFLFFGMAATPAARKKKEEERLAAKKKKDDDAASTVAEESSADESRLADVQDFSIKFDAALQKGALVYVQSEDEFHALVTESKKVPVFFDFTAAWCKPCQALKPAYESEALASKGRGLFCIVDMDDLDDVAMDQGVTALPAILCFKGGALAEKMSGPSSESLQPWVVKMIGRSE